MNPISTWMSVGCLSVALLAANVAAACRPPIPAGPQDQQKPTYSVAEYNAFQAAHNEQNATAKLKALDDFSAKYPTPDQLTPYVYRDYYLTYYSLKNYPQTLVFVDKLLAMGDKVDFGSRLEALVAAAHRPIAAVEVLVHEPILARAHAARRRISDIHVGAAAVAAVS